jgi:acyl carrier protein
MASKDIEQEISAYIVNTFLAGENVDDLAGASLLLDGILDSLKCLRLACWLEERFDISVAAHEVDAENFDDVKAICRLIERKRAEA